VPSVHPRCNQHGLVAPDGMCVLCRKASSAPPSQPRELGPSLPLKAADVLLASTDRCAALLVGVALLTMATTYVLDTAKVRELAQLQQSEAQRQQAETERLQALLLAANEAEEPPMHTPIAPEHKAPERDDARQAGTDPDPE
jgi:hypothetical protein